MNQQFGKIAEFATAELAQLRKVGTNFIQTKKNGKDYIEISNWTIVVELPELVVCTKKLQDPIIFHSKTCAIIYVVMNCAETLPTPSQYRIWIKDYIDYVMK